MKVIHSITEAIGNTPLLKLEKLSKECNANIYAKCEFFNPTSSIKDRIALGMIEDALQSGAIKANTTIIEPTSGNTGIGLAAVCAAKGIKLILIFKNMNIISVIILSDYFFYSPLCKSMTSY